MSYLGASRQSLLAASGGGAVHECREGEDQPPTHPPRPPAHLSTRLPTYPPTFPPTPAPPTRPPTRLPTHPPGLCRPPPPCLVCRVRRSVQQEKAQYHLAPQQLDPSVAGGHGADGSGATSCLYVCVWGGILPFLPACQPANRHPAPPWSPQPPRPPPPTSPRPPNPTPTPGYSRCAPQCQAASGGAPDPNPLHHTLHPWLQPRCSSVASRTRWCTRPHQPHTHRTTPSTPLAAASVFLSAKPHPVVHQIQKGERSVEQVAEVVRSAGAPRLRPQLPPGQSWPAAQRRVQEAEEAGRIKVLSVGEGGSQPASQQGDGDGHLPCPGLLPWCAKWPQMAPPPPPHSPPNADDDPVNQMVVQTMLTKAGFQVLKAADGEKVGVWPSLGRSWWGRGCVGREPVGQQVGGEAVCMPGARHPEPAYSGCRPMPPAHCLRLLTAHTLLCHHRHPSSCHLATPSTTHAPAAAALLLQALDMLGESVERSSPPDIMLLDVMMPGLSG